MTPAGKRDGLDWVLVVPKRSDADFREARLGFTGGRAQAHGAQGQAGADRAPGFLSSERNAPVPEAEVTFTPPAGRGRDRHADPMNSA